MKELPVNIEIDNQSQWLVVNIPELWIVTQWKDFDELLKNLNEALICTYEAENKKLGPLKLKFNFLFMPNNALVIWVKTSERISSKMV